MLGEFGFEREKGLEMTKNVSVPEGYKKTELRVIPEEWKVTKLEDCCNKITDGSHYSPKSVEESYYKIATIANINNNKFDLESCKNISKEEYEKLLKNGCKPNIGDVLFSKDGTVGLCLVHKQEANLVLLSSIAIIPPKREVLNSDFCAHMLKSDLILNEIIGRKTGTAIRRVVLRDLKTVKIPIPTLPEQQKIASILSKVDEQIEQTEQIIEKTELLKKGLMQKLLTKGIGHTKFKKTELGEIPEEWSVVTIGDVITLQRGHDLPVTERTEGDFPVVGSNGIVGYHNEYKAKGPGVSMGRSGTIGKIYYCDSDYWPLNTSLYVKDFKNNNPKFIYYLLQNLDYERFNSGTSVPTLNRNLVHPYKIIFPKQYDEQQKIAYILSKVDSQIQDNQNYLSKLQELKKGLMQDLLTGKVRV